MKSFALSMAFVCTVLIHSLAVAQCIQVGPLDAALFSNNTSLGTVAWNNPGNAALSDGNRAQATQVLSLFDMAPTNYLVVQNLGFAIPTGAAICGISVAVERSAGGLSLGGSVEDLSVKIVKNGSIAGTEHASATGWPSGGATATYGSSTDTWGLSWLPSDINANDFGVAIAASLNAGLASVSMSARIDHVNITVHYMNPFILPAKPRQLTVHVTPAAPAIGFYPNPAGNSITITGKRKTAAISIKDLEGRLIKSVNMDPAVRLPQLSLVGIKPGLYLLEIDGSVVRLQVK
jgi:hypothetical protein